MAAFWRLDPFTSQVVHDYGFQNFRLLWESDVYRTITIRTIGIALAVTVTDILLAFPIAFYMAKVASRRTRNLLVVAILLLWASYLVKSTPGGSSCREEGILNWALGPFGTGARFWQRRHLARLQPSVAAVHDPAGLRRAGAVPTRCSGLCRPRRRGLRTLWRVVLPLALPQIAAGSIFLR